MLASNIMASFNKFSKGCTLSAQHRDIGS